MLLARIKNTIEKFHFLNRGDRVIVAVSGGPDSTALLLLLNGLKRDYNLKLFVAHLDHKLRPASHTKKDYEYVKALSRRIGVPLISESADVSSYAKKSGLSIEEAARDKRYEFLLRAAKDTGAKKIAMGHTLDDQAETVLMRLIRGSGLGGLRGIPPMRPLGDTVIIRPLIKTWRREVEAYLKGMGVKARQDATNLMPKFLRNRIRHELIGLLEKYNPNIKEVLARSAQNFSYDYEIISDIIDREFERCVKARIDSVAVNLSRLKGKPAGIRRGILRKAIEISKGDLRGIDYSHIEDMEGLIKIDKGAVDLPGKIRAVKARGILTFGKIRHEPAVPKVYMRIPVEGSVRIPELKISFETKFARLGAKTKKPRTIEYIDFGKIKGSLHLRTWEKGDRFRPLGMLKEKKLQDFFVDQKVPRSERRKVPLLVSGNNIIWVCGLRISDDVKITGTTKKILKILYRHCEGA